MKVGTISLGASCLRIDFDLTQDTGKPNSLDHFRLALNHSCTNRIHSFWLRFVRLELHRCRTTCIVGATEFAAVF